MRPFTLFSALLIVAGIGIASYRAIAGYPYVQNPDPNHTHADFAVWVNGQRLDFSDQRYMSGGSADPSVVDEAHETHHKFFHLHDGNGEVIHRHKPGLPLGEFFASLGFSVASETRGEWCWYTLSADHPFTGCESRPLHLYVNGTKWTSQNGPLEYVFQDDDTILLTDTVAPVELQRQLDELTDDACLYSKTCPWRGQPPTENCIADPTVPCVVQ